MAPRITLQRENVIVVMNSPGAPGTQYGSVIPTFPADSAQRVSVSGTIITPTQACKCLVINQAIFEVAGNYARAYLEFWDALNNLFLALWIYANIRFLTVTGPTIYLHEPHYLHLGLDTPFSRVRFNGLVHSFDVWAYVNWSAAQMVIPDPVNVNVVNATLNTHVTDNPLPVALNLNPQPVVISNTPVPVTIPNPSPVTVANTPLPVSFPNGVDVNIISPLPVPIVGDVTVTNPSIPVIDASIRYTGGGNAP